MPIQYSLLKSQQEERAGPNFKIGVADSSYKHPDETMAASIAIGVLFVGRLS